MPLSYASSDSRRGSTSLTFRLEHNSAEKLRDEAQKQGISLNSLVNQVIHNFFEWHMFEPKIGLVPIFKPVVKEVFMKISKEEIRQIAVTVGKDEFQNAVHFMKGRLDLNCFLDWLETRMKNSSIHVSRTFDSNSGTYTYIIKHDICENWSIYLKEVIETIFNDTFQKKVEASASSTMLTFKFKEDD